MQKSTIVFYTAPTESQGGFWYQHEGLDLVRTYEKASYSVVVSLAEYMGWKFPDLPCPSKEGMEIKWTHREASFPNSYSIFHDMYDHWCDLLCSSVESGNALRVGEDCYFKI